MAIVLFTDFGPRDLYVGQVKAALDREAPGVAVIDLLNDVPAFNIKAAAHLLASLVPGFPQGSVFLAVVDPGVGGPRAPVALRADGYRFVGPDNGLLSVFAARAAHGEAFRIVWTPGRLSTSFHGRDLFAPVAARIAADTLPRDWLRPLPRLAVEFGAEDLAEIIYVDHFGNAMTGIRASSASRRASLVVNGHYLDCARVFSAVPQGEAFWYENSQGLVEIAVNQGSAAESLELKIGDRIGWAT
ncbi:MAG: SAM-dependent chlorinase/fluorinase [Burkholderiales bacterium]